MNKSAMTDVISKQELADSEDEIPQACVKTTSLAKRATSTTSTTSTHQQQRTSVLSKVSARLSSTSKRKSLERSSLTAASDPSRTAASDRKTDSLRKVRKRRSSDRPAHNSAVSLTIRFK